MSQDFRAGRPQISKSEVLHLCICTGEEILRHVLNMKCHVVVTQYCRILRDAEIYFLFNTKQKKLPNIMPTILFSC